MTMFAREKWLRSSLLAALLLTAGAAAQAEVRLARIFSDHAVLQRGQAIAVWGWARPGEPVQVDFNQQSGRGSADAHGRWRVLLKPEAAGGPYTLTVRGDNTVSVKDVLVGEVWLASGQSNMELNVGQSNDAAREVAQSNWPLIRHFKVAKTMAWQAADDIGPGQWQVSSPASSAEFSAVGYFFARKLQQELGVPIGIINASWGGSNLETWLSADALAAHPTLALAPLPVNLDAFRERYRNRMQDLVAAWQPGVAPADDSTVPWQQPELDDSAWTTLHAPQYWEEQGLEDLDGVLWYRRAIELTAPQAAAAATLHLGMIDDCDESYVNGRRVGASCGWDTPRHYALAPGLLKPGNNVLAVRVTDTGGGGGFHGAAAAMRLQTGSDSIALAGDWKARVESPSQKEQLTPNDLPTLLFNAMISPLTDFPVRGVLWYQGESNVTRAHQYAQTFPLLIKDWRRQWQQPQLPFYFVQLASFLPLEKNSLAGSNWAELREAQRQTLQLPGTGMVVATDIGDANDIHPRNKQAVGMRLALHALKNEYGHRQLVASGPLYRSLRRRGAQLELSFTDVGRGLVTADGGVLRGFTLADERRQFLPAQACIEGSKVIVWHPAMAHPQAVRYGWVDNAEESNLANRDGLPASPFRSDDWPGLTDQARYRY
ncbi:MAG: sialate O-acetylesterase [Rhodoferax sp.]|uniref:sialate O-acetylesterase n=1 Tax=Rhodoferax sp. TaxID=50421 RepID=UPI002614781A|nr:sialate O-acetylesterase [Rhodoferax sp.]MDD5332176.1 sialate O-acetylesterase [Rhodoferax sp.]